MGSCSGSCCKECGLLFAITFGAAFVCGSFTTVVQKSQAIGVIVDAEAYEVEEVPANGGCRMRRARASCAMMTLPLPPLPPTTRRYNR